MKVKIYNNNDIYEISIEEPANNIKWLIEYNLLNRPFVWWVYNYENW